jgi:23S rRNA G2445 N2-methylase RlmL
MSALTANNTEFKERSITVAKASASQAEASGTVTHEKHEKPAGTVYSDEQTIFVSNLPYTVTEAKLKDMFSKVRSELLCSSFSSPRPCAQSLTLASLERSAT